MSANNARDWQLLTLSGNSDLELKTATENLLAYLKQEPEINLEEVAYALQQGKSALKHRRMVVCQDAPDAIAAFKDPKRLLTSIQNQEPPVAFMFPGLGTQYVNMAGELYQVEPRFRQEIDYCCEFLKEILNQDLRDVIYPDRSAPPKGQVSLEPSPGLDLRQMLGRSTTPAEPKKSSSLLNQTHLAQPAMFVIEYALAQLLISWGIRPQVMIGYSIGEYVAATIAGVLSLEEGLTLIATRGQMIQKLPQGAMLAVPLPQRKIAALLNAKLSLSAVNGATMAVVAGDVEAIETLEKQLTNKGLACRRLETTHAFHSYMMNGIASELRELVTTFDLRAPKIPYISNVTGNWISKEEATHPEYWVKHLCQPVLFAPGIKKLYQQSYPILLELGPGQTLGSFALQCIES
ncbi:MAG: acyltransferase domain-containing protein, partial [Cyanobacteria bacterium J06558_2]